MRSLVVSALTAALLGSGCAKQGAPASAAGDTGTPAAPRLGPLIADSPADVGLAVQEVDLDGDGIKEVRNYLAGGTVVRRAYDLNGDGQPDVVSHYGGGGSLEREEMDGDFDGRVDWVDHYTGGVRVKAEADTNYDGRVDVIFHYENGSIVKKERL